MDQITVPEPRSRSRSKTPFVLRSHCDKENCTETDHLHGPVKKNPTVQTITEETESSSPIVSVTTTTPEIDATERVKQKKSKTTVNSSNKMKSSHTTATTTTTSTISSEVIVITDNNEKSVGKLKKHDSADSTVAAIQLSTNKKTSTKKSTKEQNQNETNNEFEKNSSAIRSSTPILSKSIQTRNKQSVQQQQNATILSQSNGNTDLSDHAAYKEYKEAGEYWNKYPKTDYTYSKLSPHRRELGSGLVAMPNMSRPSLEHHDNRINVMARNNPEQEAYIRSRYQSQKSRYEQQTKFSTENFYDSQDEVDLSEFGRYNQYSTQYTVHRESIIRRIVTSIVSTIYNSWYNITRVFRRSDYQRDLYYTRIEAENKGVLRTIGSYISSAILSVFRCLYMIISTVLFFDSWLLKSSKPENGNKKRFLLMLLILLPLLLLGAWRLADENERRAFTSRLPALPLGLPLTIKSSGLMYDISDFIKNRFDFQQKQSATNPTILKDSLTDQQYQKLLTHINGYIETLITEKTKHLNENIISQDMSILIATLIKENIVQYKYELTSDDIDRIADVVRSKLTIELNARNKDVPVKLSSENIMEITKIIKEHTITHLPKSKEKSIDIDEILLKILSSSKLIDLIDRKIDDQASVINGNIQNQNTVINDLKLEIGNIKATILSQLHDNDNLYKSLIQQLSTDHNSLAKSLDDLRTENDDKFKLIRLEFDDKLLTLKNGLFASLDERVKVILSEILGYKLENGNDVSTVTLQSWIQNVFVAKKLLETKLKAISDKFDGKLVEEINRSADKLMAQIGEKINSETILIIEKNNEQLRMDLNNNDNNLGGSLIGDLNEADVQRIVKDALAVYDADKTGLVDYALESAGGEILSTRCTENYHTKSAQLSIFGIPLWYQTNTPRTAISPSVQPGQCWAFQGFPGFLVLKLNSNVFVTGFTLEHIPKSLAPNGRIDSAPRLFTVWGLKSESDHEPQQFGSYEFLENGASFQYFRVQNTDIKDSFNIAELRIESNYGNQNYTCLYRFRVHGAPER